VLSFLAAGKLGQLHRYGAQSSTTYYYPRAVQHRRDSAVVVFQYGERDDSRCDHGGLRCDRRPRRRHRHHSRDAVASSVLANDSSPDAGTLEASVVASPAHGNLTLNADGTFSYTPSAGFFGSDSFTYRTTNTVTGANAISTVSIAVTRLNDAPTSLTLTPTAGTHYTGQAAGMSVAVLSSTDPDPEDAGQLTLSLVSRRGFHHNADFTINGATLKTAVVIDASAGSRPIDPRPASTDSMGLFREETFTVTFTQAPTAAPATFDGDEDMPSRGACRAPAVPPRSTTRS